MKRVSERNLGVGYQRALDDVADAERKLRRAYNAWQRACARQRSLERRLDKMQIVLNAESSEPPLGESEQAKSFAAQMGYAT